MLNMCEVAGSATDVINTTCMLRAERAGLALETELDGIVVAYGWKQWLAE